MEFANLAQATAEDRAAVTNLTAANSTLTEQVVLYANRLSTKEADNIVMQMSMKNLQGGINNLKAKVACVKKSGHYGGAGTAYKDNIRMVPRWKKE